MASRSYQRTAIATTALDGTTTSATSAELVGQFLAVDALIAVETSDLEVSVAVREVIPGATTAYGQYADLFTGHAAADTDEQVVGITPYKHYQYRVTRTAGSGNFTMRELFTETIW